MQRGHTSDIYDLASVTKICATTLSIMKLVDEGKLSLDDTFGDHVPMFKGTNKANLKIRDVMAHHGRLKAWIPFYKETMLGKRRKRPNPKIYKFFKIANGFKKELKFLRHSSFLNSLKLVF